MRARRRLASWSFASTVTPNSSDVSSPSKPLDKLQTSIFPELIISSKSIVDFGCSRIFRADAENKNRPIFAVIPADIFTFCISAALPNSVFQKFIKFVSSRFLKTLRRYFGSFSKSNTVKSVGFSCVSAVWMVLRKMYSIRCPPESSSLKIFRKIDTIDSVIRSFSRISSLPSSPGVSSNKFKPIG